MASGHWRPLLEGDLAGRAWEAVNAIEQGLDARAPADFVLGGGEGMTLLHGYLAKALGAERHAERVQELLDEAVEALATTPMRPALYSGFTGIAWTVEHLGRLLGEEEQAEEEEEDEDIGEEIDAALLTALGAQSWAGDYDLISGLVGFGVYALERVPRPSAVRCLEAIVDRLDETAEKNGQEVTWFTPPEMIPPANLENTPLGQYNLGVAHGVPGVIPLLADACRLGIREERARPLLEGAVRWVTAQRLAGGTKACFPSWVAPGVEPRPSRFAWCYGDPGIAAALLYAARAVGVEEWESTALAIAAHAAGAATLEDAGVMDPGLCHGAFGLAHLYNRIHQAGGGEPFGDVARHWYRLGLDMRKPDRGIGGFEAWVPGPDRQLGWDADPGFLTGASGIGLALLAAVTPVEPEWDRLLLVAIPPRPR